MKLYRVIIIFALVVMCGLGWMIYVNDTVTTDKAYRQYVEKGDDRFKEGLYELAIESYRAADGLKPSEAACERIINAYEQWYKNEPEHSVRKGLEKAYNDAISRYPKNISFWEGYARECINNSNYSEVVSLFNKAGVQHISSDNLTALYKDAFYAVKLTNSAYEYITLGTQNSIYTYGDGAEQYGTLKGNGSEGIIYGKFNYISPAGAGGIVIAKDENGECFGIDLSGKKVARFMADIVECRGPGGQLLAARLEGRDDWCFIDYNGEEQFGGYLNAGSFAGGKAPVQLSNGSWTFIDEEGNQNETLYEDVLVDESGNFLMNNCVFVKDSGKWILKNLNEKDVDVFTCDEIDISRGEAIAFCDNGKWGFVRPSGEVIIQPAYENARSFSGGVAAVCVNGMWGFVDTKGEMVIEPEYANAGYFDKTGGTCPVIDREKDLWQLLIWRVSR